MEDSIALANALSQYPDRYPNLERALSAYELQRKPVVETLQAAAHESRTYFETLSRYLNLEPVPFTFNLLTRSGRVTYDDLRLRDPRFGELVDRWCTTLVALDQGGRSRSHLPALQASWLVSRSTAVASMDQNRW